MFIKPRGTPFSGSKIKVIEKGEAQRKAKRSSYQAQ
jgi:hypothetical protein